MSGFFYQILWEVIYLSDFKVRVNPSVGISLGFVILIYSI